ncbi:U3 small nucleolar RNA-associated protein 12 (UTP12) [Vairimorpha necatrix]|uniref:Elongator complex protein 2 n=1 Tax=Vairimorpha necatrix TaxID=6039 RepID=A0AAX4JC61_9MICR
MIRQTVFGGCNIKTRTSLFHEDGVYFCSSSNILITDDVKVKEVVFLDGFLNFVQVVNSDFLLSGDNLGNLYLVRKGKEANLLDSAKQEKLKSNKNRSEKMSNEEWVVDKIPFYNYLQDACFVDPNFIVCAFLKAIKIYDFKNMSIKSEIELNTVISCMNCNDSFVYVGTTNGDLFIYNLDLVLKHTIKIHDDRVQDLKFKKINQTIFMISSSTDSTIKIWQINKKFLKHVQTLVGHNDWVSQVNWTQDNSILSSSSDKTIRLWKFTDLKWECDTILGGAWIFYKFDECISDFISGHTDSVTKLDWSKNYLLSTSLDKTVRIFYNNREVGRPLTHGYEIQTGAFVEDWNLRIIVGGNETILRVLKPTYLFYQSCEWMKNNLKQIAEMHNNKTNLDDKNQQIHISEEEDLIFDETDFKFASVPAELSLTNDDIDHYDFQNVNEFLLSTTGFSEIKKVYGHYFEISDLAVSKNFIASSNKSLTKKFGGVFLWNKKLENIDYLEVHSYGINKLRFSPDEKYLCSVSKDKTSCIYEITHSNDTINIINDKWLKVKYINNDHKRIVWDCAFSFDSKYIATCSRDKNVFIYDLQEENKIVANFVFQNEVTALDFGPKNYTLVAGTEKGEIHKIIKKEGDFKLQEEIIRAHSQGVTVIRFNKKGDLVATGGHDGLINIYKQE